MGISLSSEYFNTCDNNGSTSLQETGPSCLNILLILKQVLQHFSNEELLRLSLVSKLWHSEARSLMAKRGSLIANPSAYLPHKHLAILASDLKRMKAARISLCGIYLKIGPQCYGSSKKSTSSVTLDPKFVPILDLLKWRNLSVTLGADWNVNRSCQGFLLLKNVFEDKCGDLVEISLIVGTNLGEAFIQEFLQERNLPGLRTLRIQVASWWYHRTPDVKFVNAIISRAPKLQRFYGPASVLTQGLQMEGTSAVVIPTDGLNPCDQQISESLLHHIRLEKIRIGLMTGRGPYFRMERFNRIMPVLLEYSCTTLNSMAIDLLLLLPLINYGIRFKNVTELLISVRSGFLSEYDPAILEHVKAFNFTWIFPNLNKICFSDFFNHHISADTLSEFTKKGSVASLTPAPVRSMRIKNLAFHAGFRADEVQFFAQMFPQAETLYVSQDEQAASEISFGLIWEHWMNLKGLEVVFQGFIFRENIFNLDSVFCGIFPEEVAELRKKDDEYLKTVHIVPVMPSFTCLREMRTLRLDVLNICIHPQLTETDAPLAFSKVTYLIAFARCPYLSVEVELREMVIIGGDSSCWIQSRAPEEHRYKNKCTHS